MMESTSFGVHGRKKKEFRGVWVTEALEEVPGKEFEMVLPIVEKCWFRLLHIISLSKICWLLISRDLIFGILWFLLGFISPLIMFHVRFILPFAWLSCLEKNSSLESVSFLLT